MTHQEPLDNQAADSTQTESNPLQEQLHSCQAQVQDLTDKLFRRTADFDNYQKRMERDRINWMALAQKNILLDILAIVDDFDRALEQSLNAAESDTKLAGFALISKSLSKVLEKYGVKPMTVTGKFDPLLHESILHVESENHSSGDVVAVLQKGYFYKDELLRPAKVSVAR